MPTSIGSVAIAGGALFDDIANLPADESAVYGTAGNASDIGVSTGSGFTDPIGITFPKPITGFFLDVPKATPPASTISWRITWAIAPTLCWRPISQADFRTSASRRPVQ